MEYVRGKDLVAALTSRSDTLLKGLTPADASPPAAAVAVADALLRRGRLVRCVRQYTRPKPGMDRVAKWPRHLVQQQAAAFELAAFYAWQHDRVAHPWAAAWSALLVVAVLVVCCFPLAPHWAKLGVVYVSGGLLTLMIGLIAVRSALAAVTWAALGSTYWLLPNLLDDDKGFVAAFQPTLSVEPARAPLAARAGVAAATVVLAWALATFGPDAKTAKAGAAAAHDAILDALNLHAPRKGKLGDGSAAGPAAAAAAAAPAPAPAAAAPVPSGDDEDEDDDEDVKAGKTEL